MGISSKTRIKLAERAGWRCVWCSQKTRQQLGWQNSATVEHMTPASEGGSNRLSNLASACYRCNCTRRTTDAEQFASVAKHFAPDTRTVQEALHSLKKQRKQNLQQLCGQQQFTYVTIPDSELNSKQRLRKDRTLVRQALQRSRINPFETGSRCHRLFEVELARLPQSNIWWQQKLQVLTGLVKRVYCVLIKGEKQIENRSLQQ